MCDSICTLLMKHWAPTGLLVEMLGMNDDFMRLLFICPAPGDKKYRLVGQFTKDECRESGRSRQKIIDFVQWCVNVVGDNLIELLVYANAAVWEHAPVQVMNSPLPL